MSGTIPAELVQLSQLIFLWLDGNQLSGTIPVELSQLSQLTQLFLNNNQLSGAIPVELSQLSQLTQLFLNNNQLSGAIPVELSQLKKLTDLALLSNQLNESIPTELGQLSHLVYLGLEKNQLSGTIPVELSQLSQLTYLGLNNNQLSGTIPVELGQLSQLTGIRLDNNQLSGVIPAELGKLSQFIYISLGNNCLSVSVSTLAPEFITFLNQKDPSWQRSQNACEAALINPPHKATTKISIEALVRIISYLLPLIFYGLLAYFWVFKPLFLRGLKSCYHFFKRVMNGKASQHWDSTEGKIIEAHSDPLQVKVKLKYSFNVNGQTVEGTRISFNEQKDNNPNATDSLFNINIDEKYPVNGKVTVYYDNNNPSQSTLEKGIRISNSLLLSIDFVSIIFGLFVLNVLIKVPFYKYLQGLFKELALLQ